MVLVEDRSSGIGLGKLIVLDCWKLYFKLFEYGYYYEMVNYLKEFVNESVFNIK